MLFDIIDFLLGMCSPKVMINMMLGILVMLHSLCNQEVLPECTGI